MDIRELRREDIPAVKAFTDRAIGDGYYSEQELYDYYQRSLLNERSCSLVLVDEHDQIRGLRLSCAPGKWQTGKGQGLSPEKWEVDRENIGYFQSLFIDPDLTGKGWGKRLSLKALVILKQMGAEAVICHSWKESPNDSSGRYLRSLGFQLIATHPFYWKDVDYVCTRCGQPPCQCTAEEMIKYL